MIVSRPRVSDGVCGVMIVSRQRPPASSVLRHRFFASVLAEGPVPAHPHGAAKHGATKCAKCKATA
eukprot:8363427-Pyramimonas_sp.AAC.1